MSSSSLRTGVLSPATEGPVAGSHGQCLSDRGLFSTPVAGKRLSPQVETYGRPLIVTANPLGVDP